MEFEQAMVDGAGDVFSDDFAPAGRADESFDHAGTDFGDVAGRHQKYGANLGIEVAIDISHGALVLVIACGADAAQNVGGMDGLGVVDQVEVGIRSDGQVGKGVAGFAQHFEPVFDCEGGFFLRVNAQRDDQMVEQAHALFDHP